MQRSAPLNIHLANIPVAISSLRMLTAWNHMSHQVLRSTNALNASEEQGLKIVKVPYKSHVSHWSPMIV